MLLDGSINPGEMISFNHSALGAVADWIQRKIGGLIPAEPGYHSLKIFHRLRGGLTQVKVQCLTPYGMAKCAWKIEGENIILEVSVPSNTCAKVTFLGRETTQVESGSVVWCWSIPDKTPISAVHSLSTI